MLEQEIVSQIEMLKKQGFSEEEIAYHWALLVRDDKITPDEFAGLMICLGAMPPKGFDKMTDSQKKAYITKGLN